MPLIYAPICATSSQDRISGAKSIYTPLISVVLLGVIHRTTDADSRQGAPLRVFTEKDSDDCEYHEKRFLYAGMYTMTDIRYFHFPTNELKGILDRMWTGEQAEVAKEKRKRGMERRWAMITVTREPEEKQGSNPMESLKEEPLVNEMLEETRSSTGSEGMEKGGPQLGDER